MVRVLSFGVAAVLAGGVLLSAGAAQASGPCSVWKCGFNGISLNGVSINGPGLVLQGTSSQGVALTRQSEAPAANLHVIGIRLADGTELTVTAP